MNYRYFFLILPLVFFNCRSSTEIEVPNIILILADDLGYNDLSIYRAATTQLFEDPPTCQTPNIDRLAKEGMFPFQGSPFNRQKLYAGRNI